jgi:hypothetical protein
MFAVTSLRALYGRGLWCAWYSKNTTTGASIYTIIYIIVDLILPLTTVYFITHMEPGPSTPVNSDAPAWTRLINHTHEAISLIEEIFTNKDEVNMVCDLSGGDAQIFINTKHNVRIVLVCRGVEAGAQLAPSSSRTPGNSTGVLGRFVLRICLHGSTRDRKN